jgi:hypothetical protein
MNLKPIKYMGGTNEVSAVVILTLMSVFANNSVYWKCCMGRLISMMQNLLVLQKTDIFDELSAVNIKKNVKIKFLNDLVDQNFSKC